MSEAARRLGLFDSTQNILLVGEGDLSFSLSLARAFGDGGGRRITATTFDSEVFVVAHYANGRANIAELRRRGATVLHNVDATRLHALRRKLPASSAVDFASIDAVIFNFPHPGWLDEYGMRQGLADIARHVIDTHCEPFFK